MAYSKNLVTVNKELKISDKEYVLHKQIKAIIMENGFLIKENEWDVSGMEIRANYNSFRIINIIQSYLAK